MRNNRIPKQVKITAEDPAKFFSEKELQVIRLICGQASNQEIAAKLKRNLRTIEGYRAGILDKMKVRNTAGLVIYAVKAGIYKI